MIKNEAEEWIRALKDRLVTNSKVEQQKRRKLRVIKYETK